MKKTINIICSNLALFSLLFVQTTNAALDLDKATDFAQRVGGSGDVVDNAESWIVWGLQAIGWVFIVVGVIVPVSGVVKAYTLSSSGKQTDWTMTKSITLGAFVFLLCMLVGLVILSFV